VSDGLFMTINTSSEKRRDDTASRREIAVNCKTVCAITILRQY